MPPAQIDHLVKMANQIAQNIVPLGDDDVVSARTGEHIEKFWTPSMRRELLEFYRAGGQGLTPAVENMLALNDSTDQPTEGGLS